MRAGDTRRRITIQQRSTAQDSAGGQVNTWTDVMTVWAKIEPLSGRELMTAQSVKSEVTHTITLRYQALFADPTEVATLRGVYNGRVFNFHASMNIEERNREVQIPASEGMNNG